MSGTLADLKLLLVDHVHSQLFALDPAQLVAALFKLLVQQLLGEALPLPLPAGCQRAGALCQLSAALLRGPAAAEQLLLQCLQEAGGTGCLTAQIGCWASLQLPAAASASSSKAMTLTSLIALRLNMVLEVLASGRRHLSWGGSP